MKNFSYRYEEVMEMNWFIFNDLLTSLGIVESDEDFRSLRIADHHLLVNSKEQKKFKEYYQELTAKMENGIKIKKNVKSDWDRLFKDLGGE